MRKSISKKLRFEVFKRDNFKCQYCGKSAPDVILNVDHVKPVADGGTNDILNLITSCFDCNSGKRDTPLDDQSVLAKQREQLAELQERREQLDMMIEWKKGLAQIDDSAVEQLVDHWIELAPGWGPTDEAKRKFKKTVRKYGVSEVMDAMQIAADQYLVFNGDTVTRESWSDAWNKIPGICSVSRASKDKPYLRDILYVRGILRNRLKMNDSDQQWAMEVLEHGITNGVSVDTLTWIAKTCDHIDDLGDLINDAVRKSK